MWILKPGAHGKRLRTAAKSALDLGQDSSQFALFFAASARSPEVRYKLKQNKDLFLTFQLAETRLEPVKWNHSLRTRPCFYRTFFAALRCA